MRVLIATVTAGGGHLAAAAALDETWRTLQPDDTAQKLDLGTLFSPLHRKIYSEGYVRIVERAPELWGLVFRQTDDLRLARRLAKIRRLFPSASRVRFKRYLTQFRPDIVLCTHYLPLDELGRLRSKSQHAKRADTPDVSPFVVSVVTDFEAHALWMDAGVDLYCVAAEETKARLVARGAPADQVLATGIPISAKFQLKVDQKQVRQNLGLRDDLPTFLVLSGGFGMGPVAEILRQMDKVERPFQSVVVTGKNQELRRELATADRKHPTHVLGFTTNMHELMGIADLIISKPGGLTTSEALAVGRPLLIINPIPGQEAANSDFLLEHGAAQKVNRTEDLPFRLDQLLGTPKLKELARAAKQLGHPTAAKDICSEVLRRASARQQNVACP